MSLNYESIFLFTLTLAAFSIAKITYHYGRNNILLQPLLIGVLLVIFCLYTFDIPYGQYLDSNRIFQWLLGPAVVSLAIPLYQNAHHIRQWLVGVLFTIALSASMGVLITWIISLLFELPFNTQVALITKSATTPIALSINEVLDGNKALAATVVMFTGLIGAMTGPMLLTRLGFHDHRIIGLSLGLTSHAIGTQKALEISPLCGAFSAFAMTITGGFLALFLPFII